VRIWWREGAVAQIGDCEHSEGQEDGGVIHCGRRWFLLRLRDSYLRRCLGKASDPETEKR